MKGDPTDWTLREEGVEVRESKKKEIEDKKIEKNNLKKNCNWNLNFVILKNNNAFYPFLILL